MAQGSTAATYRLDPENPWPGLAWFDESGADYFRGRRAEVAELRRLVVDAPLTVLFGRSGLGKTSLLKAGLFPALRRANFLPVYLRVDFTTPQTTSFVAQLLAAFDAACASTGAEAPARDPQDTLWDYFHRTGFRVWSAHNEPLVPVFVIDQFEEAFTLGSANPNAIARLREDLADLAENRIPVATEQRLAARVEAADRLALRSQRYRIVLSFREDFATRFEQWHELPSLMRNRLQLLPMSGGQAFEVVHGPASHFMDEASAELIVRFVASERREELPQAADLTPLDELTVEPALLSLVCRGLNDSRHARREGGGPNRIDADLLSQRAPGIVDRHYDSCMDDQPERVHRFVENELITESGFRKPCAQDDALREPYGVSLDALQVLVNRRLLRIEPSFGVTRVELIHDLLTPTVMARRDARRLAEQKQQIEQRLREQEEAQRAAEAERAARRRVRVLAATAGLALLVTIAFGLLATYANRQRVKADAQAQVARSRELAAAATTRLELDPELAVRLAMHAAQVAPTVQAESALRQALFRWRRPSDPTGTAPALPIRELKGHTDDVIGVAFSPDGTRLLTVSCDETARLWDAVTGAEVFVLRDHRSSLTVAAFSRDGRAMLTAGGAPCITSNMGAFPGDTGVRVWDVASGRVKAQLTGSQFMIVGAGFSADGREIAAGNVNGQLLVWTLATGEMRLVGTQGTGSQPAGIQWVEFSPDGGQIATAGLDGTVAIWDAANGTRLATLEHKEADASGRRTSAPVLALAYGGAADGGVSLASVDVKGYAKVWDARTFEQRREIRSYGIVNSTAFSRDGRFLVTAGNDASIWETATGARLQVLPKHGNLYAVSTTADGRKIAVAGRGGFVAMFECEVCVSMEGLLGLAAQRPPRHLTAQERSDFLAVDE